MDEETKTACTLIVGKIGAADIAGKVAILNAVRLALHEAGPFSGEPVDCVQWVASDAVRANDYNPNSVAPPEQAGRVHQVVGTARV